MRDKRCEEKLKTEAAQAASHTAMVMATEDAMKAAGLLEALVAHRKEMIAARLLHADAGPEDPPLPIGIGEKPANPPKAAKGEVEAAAGGEDKAAA